MHLCFERYQQIAVHRIVRRSTPTNNVWVVMRMLIFPHPLIEHVTKLTNIYQSGRQKLFLDIVLICVFLAMNKVEHVFIDPRAICISFFVNILSICFAHVLSASLIELEVIFIYEGK